MFWFYKQYYDEIENRKYVICNSFYMYLKLIVILLVLYFCGKNHSFIAGTILVLYMGLYFIFLVTQKDIILEIAKVKNTKKEFDYFGSRYSFKNPYTIVIKDRRLEHGFIKGYK